MPGSLRHLRDRGSFPISKGTVYCVEFGNTLPAILAGLQVLNDCFFAAWTHLVGYVAAQRTLRGMASGSVGFTCI
jgi:hypothetical protein